MLLAVALIGAVAIAGDAPQPVIPAPPQNISPGIENGPWVVEKWGNPGTATWLNDRKVMKLAYTGGDKEKVVFKRTERYDLAQSGGARLYVYATGEQPPAVSVALISTDANTWHESRPVSLKQGWNLLSFSASAKDWKTEATNWAFTTAVSKPNDVRAVSIVAYNGKASGELFVSGMRFELDIAASSGTAKKLPELTPLKLSADLPKIEPGASWHAALDSVEQHSDLIPQHWQFIGPLPDNNYKNFDVKDGLTPDRNDDWSDLNVKRWSRAEDDAGPKVDLEELYGQRSDVLFYAQTRVEAPVDGPAWLWFDCVGKAVAYVNNEAVHRTRIHRRASDAASDPLYPVPVQLKKGINTIKIKLGQEKNPPLKGLYFSVRVQRNDSAYRESLVSELTKQYPKDAADGRVAAWQLDSARLLERSGQTEAAKKHYTRIGAEFKTDGEAQIEVAEALKRLAEPNKKEDIWKIWKTEEDSFKNHLKNGEVERADTVMRGFVARYPFHQLTVVALQYRGGVCLDYGAHAKAQPLFDRALRECGDDENVRYRSLRALSQTEFTRPDHADVPVNHDVQARLDGYRRALQGGNAEDVEAALKNLADILANQAGALLKVSDSSRYPRYAGVREYVRALLQTLPPKALEAYRTAAEPRAKDRVARAEELGSLVELEAAAAEYPYTMAAGRALNRLGNAHLDRGEYALAAMKFQAVLDMPAGGEAAPAIGEVRIKLAHALLRSGQTTAAKKELERAATAQGTARFAGQSMSVKDAAHRLQSQKPAESARADTASIMYMGDALRDSYASVSENKLGAALWQAGAPKSNSTARAREYWPEDRLYTHVASFPAVENGRAYLTTLEGAQAFEIASGKELWNKNWNSSGSLLQDRFTGYPINCPTALGGKLFFRAQQETKTSLRCMNSADGNTIWSTQNTKEFKDAVWLCDPLVVQDMAIAVCAFPAAQEGDSGASTLLTAHSIVALDANNGQLRWRCAAGTGMAGIRVRDRKGAMIYRSSFHLGPPAFQDGIVYTQTGLGSVAAVHAFTGEIVWMSAYPALRITNVDEGNSHIGGFLPRMLKVLSRGPSSPLISGDTLVVAPKDATGLFAFDRKSGALRWSQPMCDARFIAGVYDGRVIAADTTVQALNLETGAPDWTFLPPGNRYELYGHPALTGSALYIPTSDALHVLDARNGKVLQSQNWDGKSGAMSNLMPLPGMLLGLNARVFGAVKLEK